MRRATLLSESRFIGDIIAKKGLLVIFNNQAYLVIQQGAWLLEELWRFFVEDLMKILLNHLFSKGFINLTGQLKDRVDATCHDFRATLMDGLKV